MTQFRLLDLFCGAGGCTKGYQQAGFHVTGVDINKQKRYCGDEFVRGDAIEYLKTHGHEFDVIHASPPCQGYSKSKGLSNGEHPMLIDEVREVLLELNKPYVIENVQGAPLINPIILTGTMFGLLTVRPRLFESNIKLTQPDIPNIKPRHAKMGRPPQEGDYVHVVGHISNVEYCRQAMGIDWMIGSELVQAIPPSYTFYIGIQIKNELRQ